MKTPTIPKQCLNCMQLSREEGICSIYEHLPGEFGRENVTDCPSFLDRNQEKELSLLVKYIDEDKDHLVEASITKAVNNILSGYEEKFKIMVVGVARRKIKAMVKMVDIIDTLLDKLADRESLDNMTSGQTIRLLSELNSSINNDLTFIMKLVNPDTQFRDLQAWIDARSVININGTSPTTEMKTDEILKMTGVSRDKVRIAFDALLNNIAKEEDTLSEVPESISIDEGDLE